MSESVSTQLPQNLLQVVIVYVFLINGGSTKLYMNPSSTKQLHPRQNLTISVSSDLTSIDSSILCRFSRQLGCSNDAIYEDLFNSVWDLVTNGTSQRYLRFRVRKRSPLDFDISIIGVQIEDEGCYTCREFDEDEDDSKSFNLTVVDCSREQCLQFKLITPAEILTGNTEDPRYSVNATYSDNSGKTVFGGLETKLFIGIIVGLGALLGSATTSFVILLIIRKRKDKIYQQTRTVEDDGHNVRIP